MSATVGATVRAMETSAPAAVWATGGGAAPIAEVAFEVSRAASNAGDGEPAGLTTFDSAPPAASSGAADAEAVDPSASVISSGSRSSGEGISANVRRTLAGVALGAGDSDSAVAPFGSTVELASAAVITGAGDGPVEAGPAFAVTS